MEAWIASVTDGQATMSQRLAASVKRNGENAAAVEPARMMGVHLVRFTDEEGKALIAASLRPFETLC